jgi:serine/threonine protein kinase
MPLVIGQTLHNNRYRIVKLIGQGGFGAVYRAWDLTLNQPVALKENLDATLEAQQQFEREARLMAGLRHPNLPRVIDHFFVPGQGQYLVMDFVEGKNLEDMLQERGQPFNEADMLPWVEQVCDALTYLHGLKPPIIHRDVKPKNIIITPDGRVILVDFGISKIFDPSVDTTKGARAVTPGYSPPEQYGSGKTDARSDVYALGATLYTLLTGQNPPESVDLVSGSVPLQPPRQINRQLSSTAERAVLQAMSTGTTQRFASAEAFRLALTQPEKRVWPKTVVGLVVLLLLLAVGGGVWVWQAGSRMTAANTPTSPTPVEAVMFAPTSTSTLVATITRQPTRTPGATAVPETIPSSPTFTATPSATMKPSATPPKTPTPTRTPEKTATTLAVAAVTRVTAVAQGTAVNPTGSVTTGRGLPLDFENFGVWTRGNEANGTFASSTTQVHSGSAAAKLSYDFPTAENDYVVFLQINPISGTPNALQVWVYGDGSRHYLNAWILDQEGQTWQVPFGQVSHTGWKQMTGYISVNQSWPWQSISGPDNDEVDYPIAFRAFVLDDFSPGYTGQGEIYLDDLTATTISGPIVGVTPIVPTFTPGSGPTPAAGTPTGTAVAVNPGTIGRILYTSGSTLLTTDPAWSAPVELGTAAKDTCGAQASTMTGGTYNLYTGPRCGVGASGLSGCLSPNGLYEVITNAVDGGHTITVRQPGSEDFTFVYQGQFDIGEGIRWSPLSDSFLFVVGDSVNRALISGSYTQIIPTAYGPTFSPDGSLILYRKPIGPGVNDIFVSNSDGTEARNVTNVAAIDKRCPAWRN